MTPEQSKNLKAGDHVCFNGDPADLQARLRQLSSDRCASRQKQISATEEDRTQARSRDMMSNVAYDA
jgi:outer membrane murein-binding lipoprotein Lpp